MNHARKWLGVLCTIVVLCLQANLAHAFPETGWWWNSAEPGRGFFIELKGDTLFMSAYFYTDDGRATWLVSNGPITGDRKNYSGRLFAVSGGGSLVGAYHAPSPESDAGAITIVFSDDNHGVLTWPGGVINISRYDFDAGAEPSFQPTGWWWNAQQNGKGYSIEVQGTTLFMAAYLYDDAGNPIWYISAGTLTSPKHYEGTLLLASGGQTESGPFKPHAETNYGSVVLDWTSLETATFTFTDVVPGPKSLKSTSGPITVTPFLVNPPLASLPASWGGTYSGTLVNDPPGTDVQTLTATGDVTWGEAAPGQQFPDTATPHRAYVITGGTATLHVEGSTTLPYLGQTFNCTVAGGGPVDLKTVFGASYLLFEANGTVTGQIATSDQIQLAVTATCVTGFGTITIPANVPTQVALAYPIHGRHRYNHSEGTDPLHLVAPNISAGATWSFTGLPTP